MKIRYKPKFGIRVIEPFQWDESNEYVQDVPLEMAAMLATYPDPNQFEIAEEDVDAAQAEVDAFIEKM